MRVNASNDISEALLTLGGLPQDELRSVLAELINHAGSAVVFSQNAFHGKDMSGGRITDLAIGLRNHAPDNARIDVSAIVISIENPGICVHVEGAMMVDDALPANKHQNIEDLIKEIGMESLHAAATLFVDNLNHHDQGELLAERLISRYAYAYDDVEQALGLAVKACEIVLTEDDGEEVVNNLRALGKEELVLRGLEKIVERYAPSADPQITP